MVVSSLAMTIPSPSLTPSVFHDHRSVRGVVPFNLEGVDFNVDSRCKVILDLFSR